jgi:hypothetical protein
LFFGLKVYGDYQQSKGNDEIKDTQKQDNKASLEQNEIEKKAKDHEKQADKIENKINERRKDKKDEDLDWHKRR